MYVALWERNFYVVLSQYIIDSFHDFALGVGGGQHGNPHDELEVDAVVAEVGKYHLGRSCGILALQLVHRVAYQVAHRIDIGAIGHSDGMLATS